MNNERASVRDLGGLRGISAAGAAYAPSQGSFLGFERAAPPTMTRPVITGPSVSFVQPGQGSFAFSPMEMVKGSPSMMSRLHALGSRFLSPPAAIATAVGPMMYDEAQRIAAEPRHVRVDTRYHAPRQASPYVPNLFGTAQMAPAPSALSPETLARLDAAYAVPARAVMPSAAAMGHTPQQHAAMPPPSKIDHLAGGYVGGQPLSPVYSKADEGANYTAAYPAPLPTMVTMPNYDTGGEAEAAAYMAGQVTTEVAPIAPTPLALPPEQRPDVNGWRWNPMTYSYYRISDEPMPY